MAQNKVRLPPWLVPEHYALTLEPDLKRHAFSGTLVFDFKLLKPSKKITLHALELAIQSVSVDGVPGAYTFDTGTETVTCTFPHALKKGRHELTVSYTGTLNDKMRGFYRSQYRVRGVDETMAVTQFESTYARYALPCVDEPSAKATFDVTLIVEKGLTTISNTIEKETTALPDGRVRVVYERTPRMSTYLLACVVGKFSHVEKKSKHGTLTRVFAPHGKEHQAAFALDVAVRCLDFYDDYFKIRYPLPVVDHIAIPDFSAGAMENWGAITYRESALLFDPKESTAQNKQRIALVIAHELAHQWFGNLVTMEWWTDLWLNEGFANYIEYLAVDHCFPEWDIWTQFVDTEMNEAMRLDALESTHPIQVEVHHPSEINEIFDAVSYAKGATVLRMLATYLGAENFRKGLHEYLQKHAYGNAKTKDLWAALEHASGKPVRRVMETWTKHGGYPVVTLVREGKRIRLSQKRYFSSKKLSSPTRWAVPMTLALGSKKQQLLLDTRTSVILADKKSAYINANVGAVGMYRTHYDTATLAALSAAVASGTLTSAELVRIVNDVFALAFSDDGAITDALAFLATLTTVDHYSVWSTVIQELVHLKTLVEGTKSEKLLNEYIVALLTPLSQKLGWGAKPQEPHTTHLLRGLVMHTLTGAHDQESIKAALTHFKAHERGSRLEPNLRPAVYGAFAREGGAQALETLIYHYEHEEMHAEKNRLLVALGCVRKTSTMRRALTYALGNKVRFQDTRWVFLSAARSVWGARIVFSVLQKHWPLILERYGKSGHDLPRFVHCMAVLTTEADYEAVRKFFKAHPAHGAARAVKQCLEEIRSRIRWRKKNLPVVESWLTEWASSRKH